MAAARPDLRHERALLRAGARVVVGMDEVGRGALAGPVSVGAVAVDLSTGTCPRGVADSKLLTPLARRRLLPGLGRWGLARAVGHASPQEIDDVGIIAALRLAGQRALAQLGIPVDLVLLDGSHDWLSPPRQASLFDDPPGLDLGVDGTGPVVADLVVRTKVKADRACSSVAAASVLAKCERDALMVALAAEHPGYAWQENKGYGAPEHLEALRLLGPSTLHRRSWRLPLADVVGDDPAADDLLCDTGVREEAALLLDAGGLADRSGGVAGGAQEVPVAAPVVEAGRRWSMMDA